MRKILFIFFSVLLLFLLYWRFQVSSVRFFDVDEFSYMHWVAQVARGERLYTDFFSYFTPGFMWAFAPIFWIYGVSASVFTAGRTVSFVIFLSILGALSYLWGITRGWRWALLPSVILAFLPLPYDKFVEIRPDNLATLFAILGLVGEIWAMRTKKSHWWFISGLSYSASLFVLVKMIPFVVVGGIVALFSARKDSKKFGLFLLGFLGPWALFFGWAGVRGEFAATWYSLTKLATEIYGSIKNYPMETNLFFYPNAAFYGGSGHSITTALVVNHAIWVLAIVTGVFRLVTPFRKSRGEWYVELMIALTFFVSIILYSKFFPLKHSQYLIPIAIFVAYYAADGLSAFFEWLALRGGYESLAIVLIGLGYLMYGVTREINMPKLAQTNTRQLAVVTSLINTVPLSSRVVDMEGRMVFWKEGYPICCLPFDTFLSYISHPVPPLSVYLARTPADYFYVGDSGRMGTLSEDNLSYIKTHFAPVPGWGDSLWKRK